ncbi:hypothetical protein U1Q18_026785, partial [Sarracenia purpurea var. burkii]
DTAGVEKGVIGAGEKAHRRRSDDRWSAPCGEGDDGFDDKGEGAVKLKLTAMAENMCNKSSECCSTHLIDGDGTLNVAGIENFMKEVKLAECGLSYVVVSIMGPQSSEAAGGGENIGEKIDEVVDGGNSMRYRWHCCHGWLLIGIGLVEVVALSSYEEKEESFKEQVANLRQQFVNSIAPGGLAGDRTGVVPASGFSFSAEQIWKIIKENKDLDLPAHKVMA